MEIVAIYNPRRRRVAVERHPAEAPRRLVILAGWGMPDAELLRALQPLLEPKEIIAVTQALGLGPPNQERSLCLEEPGRLSRRSCPWPSRRPRTRIPTAGRSARTRDAGIAPAAPEIIPPSRHRPTGRRPPGRARSAGTWPAARPRARADATPSDDYDVSSHASCSGCSNATTSLASKSSGRLDSTQQPHPGTSQAPCSPCGWSAPPADAWLETRRRWPGSLVAVGSLRSRSASAAAWPQRLRRAAPARPGR